MTGGFSITFTAPFAPLAAPHRVIPPRLKPSPLSRPKPRGGAGGYQARGGPCPVAQAEAPKGEPGVRFVNVKDGDTIPNGFELAFEVVKRSAAGGDRRFLQGHHHLIIDAPGIKAGTPVLQARVMSTLTRRSSTCSTWLRGIR